MRAAIVLLLITSFGWPSTTDAFTSGLFKLLKVGGDNEANNQTNTPAVIGLDLVVEAETYTPHFYRGRAEPTAGSIMRLIALPEDPGAVTRYHWKVGGQTMNESGQTLRVTAPSGQGEVVVEVSSLDQNGNVIGRTTNYISLSSPSLSFYEVNPLRGISNIMIKDKVTLIGDEVTVRGEPYFINPTSMSTMNGVWNTGQLENVPSNDWRTLTILRTDAVSSARVTLGASNLNTLTDNLSSGFILEI
ncbi:hypothetical protein A2837_03030 [Candidatus Kaiserbacteria bacterium RIFCSPHIGHO2_01_FULL_46_22]|uniref:PKD domain-containing protein n=1 Tax=Candidatus Kaiserbacteria bacterium RIFCSPHIGHO2_01_FULL_46_22 TaxID=1798475 RepID=A0A1F6BX98_9BACT|nr:MAG: hypothetical protein A2837_03030 [Candidatus Kaiserbacteria bacterium RIFCSPHIGHO2_01_FULL_46_22]